MFVHMVALGLKKGQWWWGVFGSNMKYTEKSSQELLGSGASNMVCRLPGGPLPCLFK